MKVIYATEEQRFQTRNMLLTVLNAGVNITDLAKRTHFSVDRLKAVREDDPSAVVTLNLYYRLRAVWNELQRRKENEL